MGRSLPVMHFLNCLRVNAMSSALVPSSAGANPSANADAAELTHFGDLADQWWDEQGAFRTLHAINPLRLEWISRHVPLQGQNVLDVGWPAAAAATSKPPLA